MQNVNVTLPDEIAVCIKAKANESYLSYSAIVRQYLIKAITEELVLKYHNEGYSYSKIAELAGTSVSNVMETLTKYKIEEKAEKLEEDLAKIEKL